MDYTTPPPAPIPVISITFIDGLEEGRVARIERRVTTIGHDLGNDINIQGVSSVPEFARIVHDNNSWIIVKTDQNLFMRVNGTAVVDKAEIHNGNTVSFSPVATAFRFDNPLEQTQTAPPFPASSDPRSSEEPLIEITSNTSQMRKYCTLPSSMQVINIGRHPSNDIVIDELVVDEFHMQIIRENGELTLVHPHPRPKYTINGLWYQDEYIAGTESFKHPLSQGDSFSIINEYGVLVMLTYSDGSQTSQESSQMPDIIPLDSPVITFGRDNTINTIKLRHPMVSLHNARLIQNRKGTHSIIDDGRSRNVYVNGQQVKNRRLRPNDEIRIGPFRFIYTDTELKSYDESKGIRIDVHELQKTGDKKKRVLDSISLVVEPGSFVALVGGSGAGKSTLLDALNGLRPAHKGEVLYNGQNYYNSYAVFRTQLGYVPQEDIVHRDLSVEHALTYAAKLRLPGDLVKDRVEKVLADVKLQPQRKLLVKKLSGGQRKRVSIALELLAEPSVFFLDEPTSGLDPGLDREMMVLLRGLANRGHTILLVTHATNNINICEYICFLCEGGRMAYFGPPLEAPRFFGKSDFAEIYSTLEPTPGDRDIPAKAKQKFLQSQEYQKYVEARLKRGASAASKALKSGGGAPRGTSAWKQFFLLSRRYLELLWNDRGNLLILLLQAPVIALILVLLTSSNTFSPTSVVSCPEATYQAAGIPRSIQTQGGGPDCQNVVNFLQTPNSNPGREALRQQILKTDGGPDKSVEQAVQHFVDPGSGRNAQTTLFIMAFAAVMFGCINSAREIVKEEPIYRRERTVNLGIVPYLFSKIGVLGVLCAFQSAILVVLVALKAPFPDQGILLPSSIEIYISVLLTAMAGLMVGLAVSAVSPNNDRATSLIPILLIPQVIFSGIIFALTNPGLQIAGGLFADRWAMAAMGSTVGLHSQFVLPDGSTSGESFSNQGTLFSTTDLAHAKLHMLLCWGMLLLMIIVFGLTTAYFLKRKDIRR